MAANALAAREHSSSYALEYFLLAINLSLYQFVHVFAVKASKSI